MAKVTLKNGNNGSNLLRGTAGNDLIYGYDPNGPQARVTAMEATRVATGLDQPVLVTAAPADDGRLFVVEKGGLIKILDLDTGRVGVTPFLDLSGDLATAGEQGLLGLAFHRDFVRNGKFYVNLTSAAGDTEIREYTVSTTDPDRADPASGRLVLRIDQPDGVTNHKAGWMEFGPDGHLYIATGDGGRGQADNAQDLSNLLGKILRLDVAGPDVFPGDPSRNYAVPADNPFVGQAGADEIWAFGLRNPFRNSFDRGTGELFIADVGEGRWKEINLGEAGANYGWNFLEGPEPFAGSPPADVTAPILAYPHSEGASVIGGHVYRGSSDALHGQYVLADFVTSRIWTLRQDASGDWVRTERTGQIAYNVGGPIANPSSFGEDAEGNLYVVSLRGDIHRLDPQAPSADRADTIAGGAGADRVYAGSGADVVFGGAGDDRLHGMAGNDLLTGGLGADQIYGGRGFDVASYAAAAAGITANLLDDRRNAGAAAGDAFADVEGLIGGRFVDRLDGNGGANRLVGGAGGDVLRGFAGADLLVGGLGLDILFGGGGADLFRFNVLADSGVPAGSRDAIRDFGRGDRIGLSAIDANAAAAGNQAFVVRASEAAASRGAGSLFVRAEGNGTSTVLLNADADAAFEAAITVGGPSDPSTSDFLL